MAEVQWGSIADWVSGTGSLAAAVVALYVAHSAQRVRLKVYCGHRLVVGRGQPTFDVFSVTATNISQRPTVITNIGFSFGLWRWKKHGIITFMQDDIGHGIPKPLSDGETGSWNVRLGPNNVWVTDLVNKFPFNRFSLLTWRVHVHTSNGGTTTVRPDKSMRELVLAAIAAKKSG